MLTPKELLYWFMKQLYRDKAGPNDFIAIRVIHNKIPFFDPQTGRKMEQSLCLYQKNVPIKHFKDLFFNGGLYEKLRDLNANQTEPGNIYFGINARNSAVGNKKEHVIGFGAYYLDLDDNKGYSKEDRAKQITFWKQIGLTPSIVIDSGHGYHAYWLLTRIVSGEEGEPVLKRMVAITGCKVKGNTFDVTRIFRLPGFLNQKRWFEHDSPPCCIRMPNEKEINELVADGDAPVQMYDPSVFETFPASENADIAKYLEAANTLPGDFNENLKQLVTDTGAELRAMVRHKAEDMAQSTTFDSTPVEQEAKAEVYEPSLTRVPMLLEEIKWPRGHSRWMQTYCKKGFDGLTAEQIIYIKDKTNWKEDEDPSASELDFRIVYHLVKLGYTYEAIVNFWMRTDLNLYRPEKEKKNPNYLRVTFDNALKNVRDVFSQGEPLTSLKEKQKASELFVHDDRMMLRKGDVIREILHGFPKLKGVYYDLDATCHSEREYYDMEVYTPRNGQKGDYDKAELIMCRDSFNSCDKFRKSCHGQLALLTDKNSDLQRLAIHLLQTAPKDMKRGEFYSRLHYTNGKFIYPKLVIKADEFASLKTFELMPSLQAKFPWYDRFADKIVPIGEVRELMINCWEDVLRVHLPRLVMATLGLQAASALRAILTDTGIDSINVPTVNVRGASSSGKTLTVKALYKLALVTHKQALISTRTSEFAMNRLIELSNFLPTIFDEFREEEMHDKYCDRVRSLVRRAFNGEMMMRGRADQSLVGYTTHGAMMVLGEAMLEKHGDVAGLTRTVPIDTDEYTYQMNDETERRFRRVSEAPLELIGPYFYQWMLQQDPKELYRGLLEMRTTVRAGIYQHFGHEISRVAENLSSIIYGCKLWDDFAVSIDPGMARMCDIVPQQQNLISYVCQWNREEGHSLTFDVASEVDDEPVVEHVAVAKNELWKFVEDMSLIIESKDETGMRYINRQVEFYFEDEEKDQLGLNLKLCAQIHNEYSVKNRYAGVSPSKVRAYLRAAAQAGAPYLIAETRVTRRSGDMGRYTVFRLSALRQMKMWHQRIVDSSPISLLGLENEA